MAFLRNLLATITGLVVFSILAVLIMFGIIGALAAAEDSVPEVKENSVLYLPLSGVIVEQVVDDPFAEAFGDAPKQMGIRQVVGAIEHASGDDRIQGIYIETKFLQASYAHLQEIRDALTRFQDSSKFIYAYGDYVSESDYFVASVSDSIFINPESSFEFNGLSANLMFYKGLFDKLEVEPVIFRVGEFKSYVEPYIRKNMSDENRLQYEALLNSMYDQFLSQVSASRGISVDVLEGISDGMRLHFAEDVEEAGLADAVVYEDVVKGIIREKIGVEEDDKIDFVSMGDYIKVAKSSGYSKDKIAVIVANGSIMPSGDESVIGGEQFAKHIKKAREDDKVKAIVLRVNSPGGSLLGSDMIWREVMRTKGEKPIIASMAGVAASGGYYISMAADTIVAQPNTITGSIGIFSMLFNMEKFFDNKLGLTYDAVGTGDYSDFITVTRELTPYEHDMMQKGVEEGYRTFISKVADGRGMDMEEVLPLAGGRVWSGEQAYERGLVDVLGSYDDAIEIAANAAGLEEYALKMYPVQKPFVEKLMEGFNSSIHGVFYKDHILAGYAEKIEELKELQGIQARLPGELTIK